MLTPQQVHVVLDLIDRQLVFFAGKTMGEYVLSNEDKNILASHRIDYRTLYSAKDDLVTTNFQLGMLSNILGDERTKVMSYNELIKFIESGQYIPLNATERATIDNLKMQSLSDIKAARGRIFQDINNVVNNIHSSNTTNQQELIRHEIIQGTEDRKSRRVIAKEIARLTGDWSRNFNKSVQYISHTALNQGRAAILQRRYQQSGKEPRMYFLVQNDACPHCVKLYLKNGEPIIFTLKELQDNGSNIGRKQSEWKATLSAVHVHCRCTVTEYIEGTVWDGKKFAFPKNQPYKSPLNRSKIKVIFNNQEYFI